MKIAKEQSVAEVIAILNGILACLSGQKFEGGYSKIWDMTMAALANVELPKGLVFKDHCLSVQIREYEFIQLLRMDDNLNEDKRYTKSMNQQRGKINSVTFIMVTTFYCHDERKAVNYNEFPDYKSLNQFAISRKIERKERDLFFEEKHIKETEETLMKAKQRRAKMENEKLILQTQLDRADKVQELASHIR